jgi:hypothetical protein
MQTKTDRNPIFGYVNDIQNRGFDDNSTVGSVCLQKVKPDQK